MMTSISHAVTPYEAAVRTLEPTYYYQLNEPDHLGGVIDSMGTADPGRYNGDYDGGVPQAGCAGPLFVNEGQDGNGEFEYEEIAIPGVGGEANLAHCSNNEGHLILGPAENYGASAITVSMFFKANFAEGGDRLFTNNLEDPETSFQVDVANQGLVVAVDPANTGEFAERTLRTIDDSVFDTALIKEEYGWFHVVASTSGSADERAENIQVWINGENRTENLDFPATGWGVDTDEARIGGRREDPKDSTTHSGAQDEVAIWLDRVLTDDEVTSLWQAALSADIADPCDLNGDGVVDVADINNLAAVIRIGGNDLNFDANSDGIVDSADLDHMVEVKLNTYFGDANLDGEFSSSDLVTVFESGLFEDNNNPAGWGQGDWDGDGVFGSGDFVLAFQRGGYELGPRGQAVASVPEPSSIVLLIVGFGAMALRRRRRSFFRAKSKA